MVVELVPLPVEGRTFSAERRVRLGDVGTKGRLRLDALARYLQDVSSDDTVDAGLDGAAADAWVVRRTMIVIDRVPIFREWVTLTTWCSGTGSRWAERRVSVVGAQGDGAEASTLWVYVDLATGRPARLPEGFHGLFGTAAGGRAVTARLTNGAPPATVERRRWPLRVVDFDVLGHVNNAAYWAVVEEELARRSDLRRPLTATMEYGAGIDLGAAADVLVVDEPGRLRLWLVVGDTVAASAVVESLR